jgi:hypothetical protein
MRVLACIEKESPGAMQLATGAKRTLQLVGQHDLQRPSGGPQAC